MHNGAFESFLLSSYYDKKICGMGILIFIMTKYLERRKMILLMYKIIAIVTSEVSMLNALLNIIILNCIVC